MKLKKLLIIDGSYQLHRALRNPELYKLCASDGHRTGGIFAFLRILNYEMRQFNHYPIVCWDSGVSKRRVDLLPNYKRHAEREAERQMRADLARLGVEVEETEADEYLREYVSQRAQISEILDALGIPSLRFKGWEGDDLMAYLAGIAEEAIIVTDDKDLLQLLRPNVSVRRPLADELVTLDSYLKNNDFKDIKEAVIVKAITGDPSDNIPGVTDGLERKYSVGGTRAKVIAKVITENPDTYLEVLQEMAEDPNLYRDIYGKIPVNPIKGFLQRHDHFLRNMELVDLSRNEYDDEIRVQIESAISTTVGRVDYFKAMGLLKKHEIKQVDLDEIVAKINLLSMSAIER